MDDHTPDNNNTTTNNSPGRGSTAEPVRSRWTPKPEQILILESIFNSGMVNPPKDETVRIRKLLEKFGAVGDANVFYWFQNRRSRSRRRQRQLQAGLAADPRAAAAAHQVGGAIMYGPSSSSSMSTSSSNSSSGGFFPCSSSATSSSSSFMGDNDDDLLLISHHMGFTDNTHTPFMYSSDVSQLHYQPGTVSRIGGDRDGARGCRGRSFGGGRMELASGCSSIRLYRERSREEENGESGNLQELDVVRWLFCFHRGD